MYGFGDYDRWKCDPEWGMPEQVDDDYEQPSHEELVLFCDTPDCLFQGEHYLSECFTAEDAEEQWEREFWSQYPDVQSRINGAWHLQELRLQCLRDQVLGGIRAMVATARAACGLPADKCDCCHETLHLGFCESIPF